MLSSSLSLSAGSLLLALLASPVAATSESYQLVENWHGESFLDYFNFHTGSDPTNGFVTYLDKSSAESAGLVKVNDGGSVYIGVDHTTSLSPSGKGRDSVRIGSKKYYDHSLVIADIAHMPGSICGSWPAFWSVGKNWPADGEIDIIEGVNLQDHNEIVMHTAGTCSITDTGMTGAVNATGCGEDLGTVGCVIEGQQGSYGTSFNKQGGGIYAMQWTEQFVKIWFFPRASIPTSITQGAPDVSQFGTPMALVQEGCDVTTSFKAQSFVFDVTFCGDWAGGVYGKSGCPMSGSDSSQSCINYVAKNPAAFQETYWEINSVKIYQTGVSADTVSASHFSSATHASATQAATEASATHATHATQAAPETTAHASAATAAASSADANVTAGTVGELGGDFSPTADRTVQSAATRYVTEFVTSTTTLCPIAEASASSAAAAATHASASSVLSANAVNAPAGAQSATSQASAATNSVKDVQTQPTAVATTISPPTASTPAASTPTAATSSSRVVSPVSSSQPTGAGAASSSAAQSVASSDRPLPTIIPAPGVSIGSVGSLPSPNASNSKPAIGTATGVSTSSASTFQGSTSSAVAPVFTGAAGKASVKFSTIIAAFVVALMA